MRQKKAKELRREGKKTFPPGEQFVADMRKIRRLYTRAKSRTFPNIEPDKPKVKSIGSRKTRRNAIWARNNESKNK